MSSEASPQTAPPASARRAGETPLESRDVACPGAAGHFEIAPGRGWRLLRRLTQASMLIAVLVSPLLGGWQRLDRARMATWERGGSELPGDLAQRLPVGEAARRAHRANRLLGGGLGVEALGIPAADPVAGTFALLRAGGSRKALLAVALPVFLALLAGRVFCGWFCPFGTLARGLGRGLDRLGWRRFRIPDSRPVRWSVLAAALAAGLLGSHALLYLSLPHLLLQQTIYQSWLLGGGGLILGVLLGLLIAVTLFGPTAYCAAVCPTGAALAGLGRWRPLRLRIARVEDCSLHCAQCDRACWLQLHPATGDPGPDCDLCARCVGACPRSNLRVGLGKGPEKKALQRAAPAALTLALTLALPLTAEAAQRPRLVLRGEVERSGVTVAISAVDLTGVRLGVDSAEVQSGVELTAFVARGVRGPADERGRLPSRDVYDGPLAVRIESAGGDSARTLRLAAPNSPRSTPRRTLYRWQVQAAGSPRSGVAATRLIGALEPGDVVELQPIAGWLEGPVSWRVPQPDLRRFTGDMAWAALVAALAFSGLLSLALAARPQQATPARRSQSRDQMQRVEDITRKADHGLRPGPRKERR